MEPGRISTGDLDLAGGVGLWIRKVVQSEESGPFLVAGAALSRVHATFQS
jgi:hypothetical protein